jgi:hypothetical protein
VLDLAMVVLAAAVLEELCPHLQLVDLGQMEPIILVVAAVVVQVWEMLREL